MQEHIQFVVNRRQAVSEIQRSVLDIQAVVGKFRVRYTPTGKLPITDETIADTNMTASDVKDLMDVYEKLLNVYTPAVAAVLDNWSNV